MKTWADNNLRIAEVSQFNGNGAGSEEHSSGRGGPTDSRVDTELK